MINKPIRIERLQRITVCDIFCCRQMINPYKIPYTFKMFEYWISDTGIIKGMPAFYTGIPYRFDREYFNYLFKR
jgi:hypothetical protein